MKTISISTATFAAIWASRHDGEETEDQILSRLLGAGAAPVKQKAVPLPKPVPQKQKTIKPVQAAKPAAKKAAAKQDSCKFTTTDLDLLS